MDMIDIFDNLNETDYDNTVEKLQEKNEQMQVHIHDLETEIVQLRDKLVDMKCTQDGLARNISELYKTTKAEIQRKDRTITDLHEEIDRLVCQRYNAMQRAKGKRSAYSHNERAVVPQQQQFDDSRRKRVKLERDADGEEGRRYFNRDDRNRRSSFKKY